MINYMIRRIKEDFALWDNPAESYGTKIEFVEALKTENKQEPGRARTLTTDEKSEELSASVSLEPQIFKISLTKIVIKWLSLFPCVWRR